MSKSHRTSLPHRYLRKSASDLPLTSLPARPSDTEARRQKTRAVTIHSIRGWLAERDRHTSHEAPE